MVSFGKLFIIIGCIFIGLGILLTFFDKIPWLGKLPGDIHIEGKYGSFYFPIVTCIILSIVLTILLRLFGGR